MTKPRSDITVFVGRPTEIAIRAAQAVHGHLRTIADRPFMADAHPRDQAQAVHELPPDAVIVTNSVFVLDEVAAARVFVVAAAKDGSLVFRPLSAHPDWPEWSRLLQAGEFWSDFDESWVLADDLPEPHLVLPG